MQSCTPFNVSTSYIRIKCKKNHYIVTNKVVFKCYKLEKSDFSSHFVFEDGGFQTVTK